jgi:hypothetical protein
VAASITRASSLPSSVAPGTKSRSGASLLVEVAHHAGSGLHYLDSNIAREGTRERYVRRVGEHYHRFATRPERRYDPHHERQHHYQREPDPPSTSCDHRLKLRPVGRQRINPWNEKPPARTPAGGFVES